MPELEIVDYFGACLCAVKIIGIHFGIYMRNFWVGRKSFEKYVESKGEENTNKEESDK